MSRGQLVEIGGGFRMPEVMAQAGCSMVEVGTTNRTHLSDFENAITDQTAALLLVHPSNFRVLGFTGISKRCLGGVHNIPTHHAMGLYAAGRALDRPEWCEQTADFMKTVIGRQTPSGYWSEGAGPVVLSARLAAYAPLPFVVRDGDLFKLCEHDEEARRKCSWRIRTRGGRCHLLRQLQDSYRRFSCVGAGSLGAAAQVSKRRCGARAIVA